MKNSNILSVVLNNFYLNDLIEYKEQVRNKELLNLVMKTTARHKKINMISFTRYEDDSGNGSRLISLWYEKTDYRNLHKLGSDLTCAEKYEEKTLILASSSGIQFYDLNTHTVINELKFPAPENRHEMYEDADSDNERNSFQENEPKIESIVVVNSNTVVGIDSNNKRCIIWDVQSKSVSRVIYEPGSPSFCLGPKGIYMLSNKTVRYYNLTGTSTGDFKEFKIPDSEITYGNELYYINDKHLLIDNGINKIESKNILYQLGNSSYRRFRVLQEGKILLKPLAINDEEFIYIHQEDPHIMAVYNFKEDKIALPFKVDKDEDEEIAITDFTRNGDNDLLSCSSTYEIRLWDISTRYCKQILSSPYACWRVIPTSEGFLTISRVHIFITEIGFNFLQLWKLKEFDLYPVLYTGHTILDMVILEYGFIAVLLMQGIEIWNIYTKKLVKCFDCEDWYGLTKIDKINSRLFVCSDCFDSDGQKLMIYDYKKNEPHVVDKQFASDLFASIDGCHIAFIGQGSRVSIYDTLKLKLVRLIELPNVDDFSNFNRLMMLNNHLILHAEYNIYIIDWEKGAIINTFDFPRKKTKKKTACSYTIRPLDDNLVLLVNGDVLSVLDISTKSQVSVEVEVINVDSNLVRLIGYDKYLCCTDDGVRLFDETEYRSLMSNKVLSMAYKTNEIKYLPK
jgi:WD40 repeat protein